MELINRMVTYGIRGNAWTVDTGLLVLRIIAGLAFVTVFEKFLPREGVWGPQQWFVDDVAEMGFPLPRLFAWLAVSSEFIGGFLLILGLGCRFAAFSNCIVTGVAAFVFHGADVSQAGLNATIFFAMCLSLTFTGPGRFSLDALFARPHSKKGKQ